MGTNGAADACVGTAPNNVSQRFPGHIDRRKLQVTMHNPHDLPKGLDKVTYTILAHLLNKESTTRGSSRDDAEAHFERSPLLCIAAVERSR
jgi:response regulator of citrate/malate metabolism